MASYTAIYLKLRKDFFLQSSSALINFEVFCENRESTKKNLSLNDSLQRWQSGFCCLHSLFASAGMQIYNV